MEFNNTGSLRNMYNGLSVMLTEPSLSKKQKKEDVSRETSSLSVSTIYLVYG